MSSTTLLPLAKLVEDLDIYPRTQVSSINVTHILAAIQSGKDLPLPVIDRKSKRIVDGFHRCRAWRKHLGDDGVIEVDMRSFADDAAIFRTAVELNIGHGLPLQEIERRRITLRLQEMGVSDDEIAQTLHVPPARIEKILVRTATVVEEGGSVHLEPLKRPHFHLQGSELTADQVRAARSAPGTTYSLLVRQLRQAIRFRLLNGADATLVGELRLLAAEIVEYLPDQITDTG